MPNNFNFVCINNALQILFCVALQHLSRKTEGIGPVMS